MGDEPFVGRGDLLYIFSEKRIYFTPEDEVLLSPFVPVVCSIAGVLVALFALLSVRVRRSQSPREWGLPGGTPFSPRGNGAGCARV